MPGKASSVMLRVCSVLFIIGGALVLFVALSLLSVSVVAATSGQGLSITVPFAAFVLLEVVSGLLSLLAGLHGWKADGKSARLVRVMLVVAIACLALTAVFPAEDVSFGSSDYWQDLAVPAAGVALPVLYLAVARRAGE